MGKQNLNVPENGVDELNDSLVSMSEKVQDNKKIILWAACAVVAVAVLVLGYIYLVRQPGQAKANDNIGEADIQMILGNDSIALAEYMSVADNDGYDAANRAALQAAIMLYQKGDYEKALNYVDKFSASESIIGAAAYSLKGDCYVNLDKLDDAVSAFKSAISKSDKNQYYTPFFMQKLARVYHEQGNFNEETELYRSIIADYPQFADDYGIDMKKYLRRAELAAENK